MKMKNIRKNMIVFSLAGGIFAGGLSFSPTIAIAGGMEGPSMSEMDELSKSMSEMGDPSSCISSCISACGEPAATSDQLLRDLGINADITDSQDNSQESDERIAAQLEPTDSVENDSKTSVVQKGKDKSGKNSKGKDKSGKNSKDKDIKGKSSKDTAAQLELTNSVENDSKTSDAKKDKDKSGKNSKGKDKSGKNSKGKDIKDKSSKDTAASKTEIGTVRTKPDGRAVLEKAENQKKVTLDSVKVNDIVYNIVVIWSGALDDASDVETLVLGESIERIKENAFSGANSLKKIKVNGSKAFRISKGAFGKLDTSKIEIVVSGKMSEKEYKKLEGRMRNAGFKGKISKDE